jgi:hypothetical protein
MATIISPRTACRYLREIHSPSHQFRTVDGETLKSLLELACYLKACEKEPFRHHVSHQHNHFSNWVDNRVLDKDLANEMSLVLEKNPMRIIVMKRINLLVHHATRTPRGREKARMILANAELPEEIFHTNDGRTIRNLWELREFLQSANDHEVSYHFHANRNDFHDWIRHTLMDLELADKVLTAKDRGDIVRHIAERISFLEAFGTQEGQKQSLSEYVDYVRSSSNCS